MFFNGDFWWQLKTGELIWQTKSVPHTDPFSWTSTEASWTVQEWLYESLLYITTHMLGTFGTALFIGLIGVMALIYLWRLSSLRCNPLMAGAIFISGLLLQLPGWMARPQMIDYALIALVLYTYSVAGEKKSRLFIIPPITLIWSNMHGMALVAPMIAWFEVGLCLLPSFNVGRLAHLSKKENFRFYSIVALLITAATLITPNGFELWKYLVNVIRDSKIFALGIMEWQPIPFQYLYYKITVTVAFIILLAGFLVGRGKISLRALTYLLGISFSALGALRHLPIAAIAFAMFTAEVWGDNIERKTIYGRMLALGIATGAVFGYLYLGGLPANLEDAASKVGYPVKAVQYIKDNQLHRVLNFYDYGGYMLYKDVPVFIDGRSEMYYWHSDVFKDYLKMGDLEDFEETLIKYNVKYILLPINNKIRVYMNKIPEVEEVFRDDHSVIFRYRSNVS